MIIEEIKSEVQCDTMRQELLHSHRSFCPTVWLYRGPGHPLVRDLVLVQFTIHNLQFLFLHNFIIYNVLKKNSKHTIINFFPLQIPCVCACALYFMTIPDVIWSVFYANTHTVLFCLQPWKYFQYWPTFEDYMLFNLYKKNAENY